MVKAGRQHVLVEISGRASTAISGNGRLAARADCAFPGGPNRIGIWDAQSGRLLASILAGKELLGEIRNIALSDDGKLMTVSGDRLWMWKVNTGPAAQNSFAPQHMVEIARVPGE